MKKFDRPCRLCPTRQVGAAAVELALVLVATMVLLPALVLFARVFHQYNILKQASQDAASYMASLPVVTMMDDSVMGDAVLRAQSIVKSAATGSGLLSASTISPIVITCDGAPCGGGILPTLVQAQVTLQVGDLGLSGYNSRWTSSSNNKWRVVIAASVPYRN